MSTIHTSEAAFESVIEADLLAVGQPPDTRAAGDTGGGGDGELDLMTA